jgi:hypothetical protein
MSDYLGVMLAVAALLVIIALGVTIGVLLVLAGAMALGAVL